MSRRGLDAPNSEPCRRFWNSVSSPSASGAPVAAMFPSAGSTTVPALRIEESACATCSPSMTPTETIVASAPCPSR